MKPEIKKQWVEALRSGEYIQGTNRLQSGGKFCCLGVLCDLAEKAGVIEGIPSGCYDATLYDGSVSFLPSKVQRWAGLSTDYPRVVCVWGEASRVRPGRMALTILNDRMQNDGTRLTFSDIADVIEAQDEHWEGQ